MNVAVLVLPLGQLWVSTHKLLEALRIKAVALVRIKLGRTRRAADVPPEAEGDVQVGSRCIASKPSLVDKVPLPDVATSLVILMLRPSARSLHYE